MKIFFRGSFLLLLALVVYSHFERKNLRYVGPLLDSSRTEPFQRPTSLKPFSFKYRGHEYLVEPVAEYELSGLVVTHNDIHAISDIYHTADSVDFKDICLIWGRNAENDAYKEVEFWSEPWTCWTRWKHGQARGFEMRDLSNNHLISDSEAVREQIMAMQIGDQIRLKGLLVNYLDSTTSNEMRETSTNRDDTGNGACEIIFVEEAEILKSGPAFWRTVHLWSKRMLFALTLTWLAFFLWDAYRPMRS